jgi:hypothetical protein
MAPHPAKADLDLVGDANSPSTSDMLKRVPQEALRQHDLSPTPKQRLTDEECRWTILHS